MSKKFIFRILEFLVLLAVMANLLIPLAIARNKVWVNDMPDEGATDSGRGWEVEREYFNNGNLKFV